LAPELLESVAELAFDDEQPLVFDTLVLRAVAVADRTNEPLTARQRPLRHLQAETRREWQCGVAVEDDLGSFEDF
jgi:hypothetical protein